MEYDIPAAIATPNQYPNGTKPTPPFELARRNALDIYVRPEILDRVDPILRNRDDFKAGLGFVQVAAEGFAKTLMRSRGIGVEK